MRRAAACWTAAAAAILLSTIMTRENATCLELLVPGNHTALTGDLEVQLIGPLPHDGRLQLLRATAAQSFTVIAAVPVANSSSSVSAVSSVRFPCGVLTLGGRYRVVLQSHTESEAAQELDVRWPAPHLALQPEHAQTYPEVPVKASLEFPPTSCPAAAGAVIPELWLQLLYCGHSPTGCANSNNSNTQVIFSQQVIGYPRRRDLVLTCELFGLAGHYVLTLRSKVYTAVPVMDSEPAHMKVVVSDKFVFNVHASSILPCDTLDGGVAVLFQYPACEPRVDRVRLFAKLRADVASLAPPTSLHYVAEQRVLPGVHSLRFNCDLFSERYVEYCFVYVNQAVTGAVTDIRMDCVPTLPVQETDSGGWGAWSGWTPCTSSCGGGTRSRYRICDSPPPRYGAKFCEGPHLQTESCGAESELWNCLLSPSPSLPADHPGVVDEVGPGCRCGCVVHVGVAKPRRILATSTVSCPGRTFWLVQADAGSVIQLTVVQLKLPCGRQWLKVHDGDSLAANLVANLSGRVTSRSFMSTSNYLLLDFFSDDMQFSCIGGFLAHVEQRAPPPRNSSMSLEEVAVLTAESSTFPLVHILATVFVAVVLLVSALIAAQSLFHYKKYQLAMSLDSELACAPSRSTLLSDVISIKKLRPGCVTVHTRLQDEEEEGDEEEEEGLYSEPECEVVEGSSTTCHRQEQQLDVAPPVASVPCTPCESPAPMRRSTTFTHDKVNQKMPPTPPPLPPPPPLSPQNHSDGKEDKTVQLKNRQPPPKRQHQKSSLSPTPSSAISSSSVATLNNGWSSPNTQRKNNIKERKERCNLERLLASGCSELSLAAADVDLEMDYYDYNVSNAGAAPGSFLGMDPQYLVWIPPFTPGQWEEHGELLEMSARSQHPSGSDSDELTEFIPKSQDGQRTARLPTSDRDDVTKFIPRDQYKGNNRYAKTAGRWQHQPMSDTEENIDFVPLSSRGQGSDGKQALQNNRHLEKAVNLDARVQLRPGEKETQVEKSPYEDDIKFVDDEDEDEDEKLEEDIMIVADNKQRQSVKRV